MPTSALWEPTNSPQISVKTVRTARADVGIGPYIGPYKRLQKNKQGGQGHPPVPLKICTIGAYVDGPLFPQQRVFPSPCAAMITDGSVVPTQAAL